ncbi:MAG: anti-sigma factor family protein, partial [Janthinobacterium lividum]
NRTLQQQAATAHAVYAPDQHHAVEVGAEQEAVLKTWLASRLGAPLTIVQLAPQGFRLLGARLLPDMVGPAALLMYQNEAGARVSLYVRKDGSHGSSAPAFVQQDRKNMFYWDDGLFGYAITGEQTRAQLQPLADAAYQQLGGK